MVLNNSVLTILYVYGKTEDLYGHVKVCRYSYVDV